MKKTNNIMVIRKVMSFTISRQQTRQKIKQPTHNGGQRKKLEIAAANVKNGYQ